MKHLCCLRQLEMKSPVVFLRSLVLVAGRAKGPQVASVVCATIPQRLLVVDLVVLIQ